MATEYKLSYTGSEINSKLGKVDEAVCYTTQTLTDDQKSQARANIGAMGEEAIENLVVTAIANANELTNISATFEEIYEAYNAGRNINLHIQTPSGSTTMLPCTSIDADNAFFDAVTAIAGENTINSAIIFSDDTSNYTSSVVGGVTEETDPTVPDWAKAATKPTYTASEIGADASGTAESLVTAHNTSTDAHPDIRELIDDLSVYVTPSMYGAVGDGVTDDSTAFASLINELNSGETVNLLGKTYVINSGLTLSNVYLSNGTIIYSGSADERVFTLQQNSGLTDIVINIRTANYASDVVYVDYMPEGNTWVTGKYIIDGLHIINTDETTTFVENSTCVRIRYYSYQVIWGQTINNLTFDGLMDYGIYIEPWLKTVEYNPVYNTSVFSNVLFKTVNCALKTLPIVGNPIESAVPATDTETQGGIGLLLNRFTNQSLSSGMTKPFMDLHNTVIEGNQVIPWDYYGDKMPPDGILKSFNSSVYLSREYSHDSASKRAETRVGWAKYSTGEKFTTCNAFSLDDVGEGSPYRDEDTAVPWSIDNARMIRFSADDKALIGMQYSFNNYDAPEGQNTVQFGFHGGFPYIRIWDKDNSTWGELLPVHVNGNMPISYSGKRPDGTRVGDMKYDSSYGYPIWWNGSAWIKADGNAYDAPNITKTSQLINDSGFVVQKNLVLTSINSDGTIYEDCGYVYGYRINSSGGTSDTAATTMSSGYISVSDNTVLNISGGGGFLTGNTNNAIAVYDESFNNLGTFTGQPSNYGIFLGTFAEYGSSAILESDGVVSWKVPEGANIAYVRISMDCGTDGFLSVARESSIVESVNGKTGAVQLTAEDVNALSADTTIPSKTSQLTNDSGFITAKDIPEAQVPDLSGYALKSSAETWTFTLSDGSTVTKKVVLA